MGKAKGKQRQDKFYHLAKEQGYRSRAAFKLLQLDARFRFLLTAHSVLDLCAAPGGWVQVAVNHAPVGAFVVGVDLVPIRPIRGAHSLTEDITTTKCRAAVRRLMDSNGVSAFDVVLHDGSPNVGGAWAQEATSQSALVIDALRLATMFLAPKGAFITKVFRSQDYNAIMYCLKQLFEKVEATKPTASRSTSAEIYIICLKYKAPAKIQPELLDIKHLFSVVPEQTKSRDVMDGRKKRHRDGYEEGNTTLRKVGLASDFIWSDAQAPLEFLGSYNAISFDNPESLPITNHELTTDDIKNFCEDLLLLDKNSFKHILKWRIRLRKALSVSSQVTLKANDAVENTKVMDDDVLLQEMEELTSVIDRKKKREKKRLSKRRAKDKARKATGMQIDATGDDYGDPDLFSISVIKGGKELEAVESAEVDVQNEIGDSENEDTQAREHSDEEMDSDEEQQRYDAQLEEMLDEAYERFVTRKGGEIKQERKRAKRINPDADADLLEGGEDDGVSEMDQDFDEDQDLDEHQDQETNPLLLALDEQRPTKEQIVKQWYSQDVFTEAATGITEQSDTEDERESLQRNMKKMVTGKTEKVAKAQRLQQDIEIVPAEPVRDEEDTSSSSGESDVSEDELDDYRKAEVLAYAKKMLRKKQREQILDDAYNKYMFDDEGLPNWFVEDEKRHRQPMKPVTREEVAAMRAQFKEIDARPSKKVAEAKARKKRVAMKKLDKARQKADAIADQNDINELSKRKMIDRIYRKAMPTKPQKEYVVAKKGVQVRTGKGKVLVDPRMKKDKRASGTCKKGKKGGKGGKGKGGQKGMRGKAGKKAGKAPS
ncbi:putative rRNA methyltransferase [Zea mays]|uniref:Putative rRNA methyltransferase n=1 Tax=Zea mays TaxID=4577 RepID=A0A3L6DTW6_MAIZE|nr:putative rRNA methyltransferase [Zea mays]